MVGLMGQYTPNNNKILTFLSIIAFACCLKSQTARTKLQHYYYHHT
jgi:hypothetical protein